MLKLIIFSLLLPPAIAFAGGQDGGGGHGGTVHCEDPNAQIHIEIKTIDKKQYLVPFKAKSTLPHDREYELVELWEAENARGPFFRHRMTIPWDPKLTKEDWKNRALNRLAKLDLRLAIEIQGELYHVLNHMTQIQAEDYVVPPDDSKLYVLPKGCTTLGLGGYSDDLDNLDYDRLMFNQLPVMDQAAFELHEAIYRRGRRLFGWQNSWNVSRMVGLMFATEDFTEDEFLNGFKASIPLEQNQRTR